jgi:hypothetical protein
MEKKKETEPKAEVKATPVAPKEEVKEARVSKPAFHHTFKAADVESPVDSDPKIKDYQKQLDALRQDGSLKIYHLKEEMYDVRRKQMIDELTRKKILDADNAAIAAAKDVEKQNAAEVSRLVKEASAYVKEVSDPFEQKMKADGQELVNSAKPGHAQKLSEIKNQFESSLAALKEKNAGKLADFEAKKPAPVADPEQQKVLEAQYKRDLAALKKDNASDVQSLRITYRSSINDENNAFNAVKQQRKEMIYGAYLARYNKMNDLRSGKPRSRIRLSTRLKPTATTLTGVPSCSATPFTSSSFSSLSPASSPPRSWARATFSPRIISSASSR